MNILFVYKCIADGNISVADLDDAVDYDKSDLFIHIGTVNSKSFLQFLLNKEDDLSEKYFKK